MMYQNVIGSHPKMYFYFHVSKRDNQETQQRGPKPALQRLKPRVSGLCILVTAETLLH